MAGRQLKLHHLLGKGASAKVYAGSLFGGRDGATQKVAVKQVTVKQSRRAGAAQTNMGAVLEQEVKMLSQLSHPSIVGYLGVFRPRVPPQQPPQYMIIMEYCAGGSFDQVLKSVPTHYLPEHEVVVITRQVVAGLAYLHSKGIMHRDIKPSNMLLTERGQIKISDFDCSTQCVGMQSLRRTCIGTPHYIAPEIVLTETSSFPADVWSLGCTVFHLASGDAPFGSLKGVAAMYRMVERPPSEFIPADVQARISDVLVDFLMACWVRDPKGRPTAPQLAQHAFLRQQLSS